ncbi:MAG: hypothetical protein KA354_05735 [Phycisphaerae bacterium]|nr:hypothetical protein [Phycisphaerae bacterium]
MGRTCDPISIANQIIHGVSRLVSGRAESPAWQEAARREFERYTLGLYDFERREVWFAVTVRTGRHI